MNKNKQIFLFKKKRNVDLNLDTKYLLVNNPSYNPLKGLIPKHSIICIIWFENKIGINTDEKNRALTNYPSKKCNILCVQ